MPRVNRASQTFRIFSTTKELKPKDARAETAAEKYQTTTLNVYSLTRSTTGISVTAARYGKAIIRRLFPRSFLTRRRRFWKFAAEDKKRRKTRKPFVVCSIVEIAGV